MRTISVVTVLFIPIWVEVYLGHHICIRGWTLRNDRQDGCEHLQWIAGKYLNCAGIYRALGSLFSGLESDFVFPDQVVARAGQPECA